MVALTYLIWSLYSFLAVFSVVPVAVSAQNRDCNPAKVDLVIVIDSSGSVQHVFKMYIEAALGFTKDLTFGTDAAHAAIIQYSKSPPVLKQNFNDPQSNEGVNKVLNALEFLGDTTNTAEAVNLGIRQFTNGRSDAKKVYVLMTDGNSFDPWEVVADTANRLHQTGAVIYIIALGENLYFPELQLYAENATLITRDDLSRFRSDMFTISGSCPPTQGPTQPPYTQPTQGWSTLPPFTPPPTPEPTLPPYTQPPPTTTQATLPPYTQPPPTQPPTTTPAPTQPPTTTTEATKAPITCPIPEGYCPCPTTPTTTLSTSTAVPTTTPVVTDSPTTTRYASPPSVAPTTTRPYVQPNSCAVDILFVLDSSGEDRTFFDKQIRFVLDILDIVTIDPKAHLVAGIVYDGHMRQRLQFSFTAYTTIQTLSTAVVGLPFFGGLAAAGEGLDLAKQALLDRRPNVPAIVFVITNGTSSDDVKGPAKALRSEPNTEVYAISVAENVAKQPLIDIAGDASHVFIGMDAEKVKNVALGKYLNCPNLLALRFKLRKK